MIYCFILLQGYGLTVLLIGGIPGLFQSFIHKRTWEPRDRRRYWWQHRQIQKELQVMMFPFLLMEDSDIHMFYLLVHGWSYYGTVT
jgi:hypothetical protein